MKIKKGKNMCAVLMDPGAVKTFAIDYLKKNPKATEADVQVATRNRFQGKVSRSALTRLQSTVSEVYSLNSEQARANFRPVETPTVKRAAKIFNTNSAYRYYQELDNMSVKAKHQRHLRNLQDAKSAFGSEEYLQVLKRNNPDEYARELARLEEQNKPVQSNNAGKQESNADYLSSKKKKAAKKDAEIKSHNEAQTRRMRRTKAARNAEYCTSQGIMTNKARKIYDRVSNQLDGSITVEVNSPTPRSAEEVMKFYIEKGLAPLEDVKPTPVPTKADVAVPTEEVATSPVTKSSSTTTPSVTSRTGSTAENVSNAGKKAAKEAAKKGGKWGWIIGGAAALTAAAIGYKMYNDKQVQKQNLNLSA